MKARMNRCGAIALLAAVTLALAPACDKKSSGDETSQDDDSKSKKKRRKKSSKSVLSRIEKFEAAKTESLPETYAFRVRSGVPVPPTLTDTLVVDIFQRMAMDLSMPNPDPKTVTVEDVEKAIAVYTTKTGDDIAGFRPFTHHKFINELSEADRKTLAKEIHAYAKANGVKDVT